MTNRALLISALGPLVATAVAAGCSSGSSGAGNGSPKGTNAGEATDAGLAVDATGGNVPPVPGLDAAAPVGPDDSSAPVSPESGTGGPVDSSVASDLAGWKLTWSDEFNGPDGSAVDPAKWKHDVGGTGWGNNELEYYTDGMQNAVVQGGNLVITATP